MPVERFAAAAAPAARGRRSASAASSGSTSAAAGRPPPALGGHLDAVRAALGPGHPPLILEPGRAPDPRRRLAADARGRPPRARARWWSTPASPRCPASSGSARRCTRPSRARAPSGPTDLFGPLCLQHDADRPRGAAAAAARRRPGLDRPDRRLRDGPGLALHPPAPGRGAGRGRPRRAAAGARDRRRGARRPGRAAPGRPRGARGVAS